MKLRHLRNCSTVVWKVTFALSLLLSIMFHPSALSFGIPRYLFLDQSFLSCTPNRSLSLLTVVTPFPTSYLLMITRLSDSWRNGRCLHPARQTRGWHKGYCSNHQNLLYRSFNNFLKSLQTPGSFTQGLWKCSVLCVNSYFPSWNHQTLLKEQTDWSTSLISIESDNCTDISNKQQKCGPMRLEE